MKYEEKYKEALKVIESLYNIVKYQSSSDALLTCKTIERAFPELRESEDERIRRELIKVFEKKVQHGFELKDGIPNNAVIAWLEKQGEQKPKEKTKVYDSMDDLIADAMIDEINESTMPESSKHNRVYCINSHRNKNIEWSEEDEKLYNSALWHIKNSCGNGGKDSGEFEVYNWLKSLKGRVQPQPKQEWNKEDERIRQCLIRDQEKALDDVRNDKYGHSEIISDLKEIYRERIDWLKSLKPNHWKPSEEQMEALDKAKNNPANYYDIRLGLQSLYNDLLKL